MKNNEFGWVFWVHLILLVPSYLSFIWLDWKLVLVGVVAWFSYYKIRGGCDLTIIEFGHNDTPFIWYYLKKIFPRLKLTNPNLVIRFIFPILLVVSAFVIQFVFSWVPVISI